MSRFLVLARVAVLDIRVKQLKVRETQDMIKALNDIVIIERDSYQGLLVATAEKMCHGTVISVGPGAWSASVWDIDPITKSVQEKWRPTSLQAGQRVCFSLDKGEEHIIDGKHVVVMRESHIAAVLEDEAA